MKNNGITEYFEEVEITREYDGYYYSVSEAITIVLLRQLNNRINRVCTWWEQGAQKKPSHDQDHQKGYS